MMSDSLVELIKGHLITLPPHVSERYTTVLLRKAAKEIAELQVQNKKLRAEINRLHGIPSR